MLPATLAQDVRRQVLHYLEATFHLRDPKVEAALSRFFNDPQNGLFKGPWVQLRRPFRQAVNSGQNFFDLTVPFTPFRHQWLAWERLSGKNNRPRHTLVTTGTGSGKTECFLYPLLDHCLRQYQNGQRGGIKAIVLYPMNALASDQAGRFAEEILRSDQLSYSTDINGLPIRKARVRVGLYTGRMQPGQEDRSDGELGTYKEVQIIPPVSQGGKAAYAAITNRQVMQQDPPDILLTNYKMLDYLLLRPKDQGIWAANDERRGLLRYLVLDELHTYDGAQGADVACLIRRLKERLSLTKGQLCVVGTSATIASSDDETTDDPLNRLCGFASTLFEEDITNDAVIQEDRYHVSEIIRPAAETVALPGANHCVPGDRDTAEAYARRVSPLFGGPSFPLAVNSRWLDKVAEAANKDEATRWALALGEWLRSHPLFHNLLQTTKPGAVLWTELVKQLSRDDFGLREVGDFSAREQVLMAFLALTAQARELRSGRAFPLVPTRVQLWIRELRRVGRVVDPEPTFSWLDELQPDKRQLPTVHCTECGESAWVALHDPDKDTEILRTGVQGFALIDDTRRIYEGWGFEGTASYRLVLISPWREGDDPVSEGGQQVLEETRYFLSPSDLVVRLGPGPCPLSAEKTFPVKLIHESRVKENTHQRVGVRRCPHCYGEDTLMFIGSQAATLSSVAIDEVFGSVLNNDPKLLAFTDSVQDASHRAGFFSARTYHFSFRTALQHVIDEAGSEGLPLIEVGERLLEYWAQPLPGRPGSEREVMATLMPSDLREYQPYLDYRNNPQQHPVPAKLRREFIERLNWEAVSEFSLMLTHGRTLETHTSACLGWDDRVVDDTVARLRTRLPGISPILEPVADDNLRLWIYGILHRQRERGGLYHLYLDSYARQNYWGKFPFGKTVPGRETYPPAGRYKPRLLVTAPDRFHDFILVANRPNQSRPWQLQWAQRVLNAPAADEATLLDLLKALLEVGAETGLLIRIHRDGNKAWYALSNRVGRLYGQGEKFACSVSGHSLYRPSSEARLWQQAPSLSYRAEQGVYQPADLNERERYYSERYRKGALRRVFAHEHTGLLTTDEREALELSFNNGGHADDPNILTATSTLEMGIDIGDLSTTMLCSVPPSTANFLQRVGRAGRSTGTALVLTVINQRPHDLFFYARPQELLNGEVEPPGCWLDASAVLVRQYLAYCFDRAVKEAVLRGLPVTGKQLVDEMIVNRAGHIPHLLGWMTAHEAALQQDFLARFVHDVLADTVERFIAETRSETLRERIEGAAREFNSQRTLLDNARKRLREQKKKLDPQTEQEALAEIEREQRILGARTRKLGEISALEVLIEHGLLPNYAFPERGVRFSGTTYNQYSDGKSLARTSNDHTSPQNGEPSHDNGLKTYELVRSAAAAIRELAPANRFYTHSHVFNIQQLEIGSKAQPLIEEWAVCGECGHLRTVAEIRAPEASPACPQCGYGGPGGQTDISQHRALLPFHRSQAVSYMEYYQSLSSDKGERRESEFYRLVASFDHTVAHANGAVGDDRLPFGIEYRAAIRLREINAGYGNQPDDLYFGQDNQVPAGFEVCQDCGVVVGPSEKPSKVNHRKSCAGRRRTEAMQREGGFGHAYRWQKTYLYRELRSEAIRLLLPAVEQEDLDTLEACIYLGMRLRFQGDPAHLLVYPQKIPVYQQDVIQHYLVLMDAVPGGTGFLKTLYQEQDPQGRMGEGIMNVLRRALAALETCECNRLSQIDDDTDGCYRCVRTYRMQYRSKNISRDRGIRLLKDLLAAGERRAEREELNHITKEALFSSVLEKRFAERLRAWVEGRQGQWKEAMINGGKGFRFVLGNPERAWELELQPLLGPAQGVSIACQPDFMLRCDDPMVKPVAIFTDGFEPHVKPGEAECVLTDDVRKRRAILQSGQYWLWSLSWDDLEKDSQSAQLTYLQEPVVSRVIKPAAQQLPQKPDVALLASHPWAQLCAFIRCPEASVWSALAETAAGGFMTALAVQGIGTGADAMQAAFAKWRQDEGIAPLTSGDRGEWLWLTRIALSEDMLAYALCDDLVAHQFDRVRIALRLRDGESERAQTNTFRKRWRRFQALLNFFQFASHLTLFTTSEVTAGEAPEMEISVAKALTVEWQSVLAEIVGNLDPLIKALAAAGRAVPQVEFYCDDLSEDLFAELAWPDLETPVALLTGDQASGADQWQQAGWRVITDGELTARGTQWLVDLLPAADEQFKEKTTDGAVNVAP
jgi:DEAD/DEAH box helicase domain-containing protein